MANPNQDTSQLKQEGKYTAIFICWILGNGVLVSWNSMLTIVDYYSHLFPEYHPSRVLPVVYQPFALGCLAILTYNEARLNTRQRILFGYLLCTITVLSVLVLDLATSGKGGLGTFIGVCAASAVFGFAEALTSGGMVGELSFMPPCLLQSYLAGMAASGALISALRLITKAAFDNPKNGLRSGAIMFFAISFIMEVICVPLYAFVFPKLSIVKYYRAKAASEGSETVLADLAAGGFKNMRQQAEEEPQQFTRLSTKQLLFQNADYAAGLLLIYTLTLFIFPGFLSEDTRSRSLGAWYPLVLIAMYNLFDLIGRYIPVLEFQNSRKILMVAILSRFLLIPAFYFTAKLGGQGWMIMLTSYLGLSHGYLTVCIFASAPKGYKGPEQNALGNLLVFFLIGGISLGVCLDWLWLIGKGW